MDYISTDFGIDSSSRFLFFRRGQADRQTDGQTQLNDLSTTLVIHPEWDNSAQGQLDAGDSAPGHFGAASVTET